MELTLHVMVVFTVTYVRAVDVVVINVTLTYRAFKAFVTFSINEYCPEDSITTIKENFKLKGNAEEINWIHRRFTAIIVFVFESFV